MSRFKVLAQIYSNAHNLEIPAW